MKKRIPSPSYPARFLHHAGFTLVEMAVVLVIIGLLVGGVVTGKSLLRNAKLRDTQASVEKYRKAINTFNDVYGALPGDMYNATSIWGLRAGTGTNAACTDAVSTDALTCNGNGNGYISSGATDNYEIFRAWQHLRNAELISGSYTGTRSSTATGFHTTVGTNAPRSSLANNFGYGIRHENGNASMFTGTSVYHYITFGANTTNNYNNGVALGTEDAWNLDKKTDDGLPGQGAVVSYTNTAQSNCASTDVATTATYRLSVNNSTPACVLLFRINQ